MRGTRAPTIRGGLDPPGASAAADAPRAWLGGGLVALGLVLATTSVVLGWGRPAVGGLEAARPLEPLIVADALTFLVFVVLGAVLMHRVRGNPVGGLLALVGLAVLLGDATQEYAAVGFDSGRLPGWQLASWVSSWSFAPALTAIVALLLLFPTGRPLSGRWRWALAVVAALGTALTITWAVASWAHRSRLEAIVSAPFDGGVGALAARLVAVLLLCLPLGAFCLLLRYRRAALEERLQLKWLAVAAVGLGIGGLLGVAFELRGHAVPVLVDLLGAVGLAGIPIAMTVAILRYHLFEIDRLISRLLAYSLLSALLAALYALGVVVIGALVQPLSLSSDLAVAGSTLLVAATFAPLRRRVQARVDRHFNRAAYDASLRVRGFAELLRFETDLDALVAGLATTVDQALQPAHVSIWLCPGGDRRPHPRHRR